MAPEAQDSVDLDTATAEPLGHRHNAAWRAGTPYGTRQAAVLDETGFEAARDEIAGWEGYAPTPLVALPGLARRLGIGALAWKDESQRFGLGSFKALGGAYAVLRQVQAAAPRQITVCCATDGNHGRSVAWGAQRFGARCVIYIHATVSAAREAAIARYGAEVRRLPGNYDDAVRQAAADAAREGWVVVSDTSYHGYMEIPRDVMQGYTVMAEEALEQWPAAAGGEPPSHLFLQAGVGGLAAAVCARFWQRLGAARPRCVLVDPDRAACLFESVASGRAASVGGDLDTMMAGLACGETSPLAWEILAEGASDALTVTDAAAAACMRLLAAGSDGDPPLVAGESAVAGLAGLLGALARPALREALGLGPTSRVLLFGSEGDTDPELYARIVGRPAGAVRAAAAAGD